MKLLTKALEKKLPPLYSQDGKDPKDVKVILKLFHPCSSYTFFVTEGSKQEDGDWLFFGLVQGTGPEELGYVSLRELQSVRFRGLPMERDLYFGAHTLADVKENA